MRYLLPFSGPSRELHERSSESRGLFEASLMALMSLPMLLFKSFGVEIEATSIFIGACGGSDWARFFFLRRLLVWDGSVTGSMLGSSVGASDSPRSRLVKEVILRGWCWRESSMRSAMSSRSELLHAWRFQAV